MRVLAIGAHPDDVELFCGGTLLRLGDAGHEIFIALATSGDKGSAFQSMQETAAVREGEQREAADLLGAHLRFLGFKDQELFDTPETRGAFRDAIRWANPDVIFTHAPEDESSDHALSATIVSRVVLSANSPHFPGTSPPISTLPSLFYWDTTAGIGFFPEAYVDITHVYDRKRTAFCKHQSQMTWMGQYGSDFLQLMEIQASFRGIQAGKRYAEAFRAFRFHGFMADLRLLP